MTDNLKPENIKNGLLSLRSIHQQSLNKDRNDNSRNVSEPSPNSSGGSEHKKLSRKQKKSNNLSSSSGSNNSGKDKSIGLSATQTISQNKIPLS